MSVLSYPRWFALGWTQLCFAAKGSGQCLQHMSVSECIVFRNQHGCVWDVTSLSCVDDTPCEKRSRQQCHTELTTGKSASWDSTTNKCIWDQSQSACRWADECFGHNTSEECMQARCSWKKLCTPDDMRAMPGPRQCRMTCVAPDGSEGTTQSKRTRPTAPPHRPALPEGLSDVVATQHGDIQGLRTGGVQKFLGVPFAQPPVGALRWAPPQPLSTTKWNGTFMATSAGASCSQTIGYYFSDPSACQGYTRGKCYGYSEDCLTLSAYTADTTGSKAVMMWIHGGCYVSGSASGYDGTNLALKHDVVVVVAQYRLAAFGWLADDLLRPRDPSGSTGNYGLMDNVEALKWIQANAGALGGDKNRVTIFGESSGAGSVSQLLVAPAAWPYFHKGIMESGTGSFWTYMDILGAQTNFKKVANATGCGGTSNVVKCLLSAAANTVSSAVSSVPCRDGCNWAPVIDGIFIKGRTVELARGASMRPNTPTISGFNLNDGASFVPGFSSALYSMTQAGLTSYFAKRFGIERVKELYKTFPVQGAVSPSWMSRYFYSAQECETDFSYACAAQWISDALTLHGSPSYVYQFSEPTGSQGLSLHGSEIAYVFGTLANPSSSQSYVSSIMMSFWTNFAKTGNPNAKGLPAWPQWDTSAPLINFTSGPSVSHFPNNSFIGCDFFDANWDYYGGCLPENPSASVALLV